MFEHRKNKKNFNREIDIAIANVMERFAEANAQHFIAYDGLTKVSHFNLNLEFQIQNKKQQAGFSAEIKHSARTNAKNIIAGNPERISRTDDVGSANHTKYDHVSIDESGNPILDSNGNFTGGSQQKNFYRVANYDRLFNKEFEHYKNTPINVPSDQYNDIINRWESKIESLKRQEDSLRLNYRNDIADIKKEQIDKIEDAKSRLRKSEVSTEDAMEARVHHNLSTIKDVAKISQKAGLESAKIGAVFGAGFSTLKNTKAYLNNEKEIGNVIYDISKDTAVAVARSYVTGVSIAVVGGVLQASSKEVIKNLAKEKGPLAIVNTAVILSKQTVKLVSGIITLEEFAENTSVEGFMLASSMTGSNLGAVVGTAIFPGVGTLVGGVIGGMIASVMSGALYNELNKTLQKTSLSIERREFIKAYCEILIEEEKRYRKEMLDIYNFFLDKKEEELRIGFKEIHVSLISDKDIHKGLVSIGSTFGVDLAFPSNEDFKRHINSERTLKF